MTVPMLDELIQLAAGEGAHEIVLGMAHRGRLNVLAHNLGRPYDTIFAEFEGASSLEAVTTMPQGGTGDVKYHHGADGSYRLADGSSIIVRLESNPSHLEYVSPVAEGACRAAQTQREGPHAEHDRNAARADRRARRRVLPRPGRRRRDLQPAGARRLHGRRHRPPDHEQPGRLHHRSRRRPLDPVGLRPGQGLRRADHPRQRRPPRGVRRRRAPGLRLPPAVRPRRAHRPDRLPPLRPQRGRRARLHPAADVHAASRSTRACATCTPSSCSRRRSCDRQDVDRKGEEVWEELSSAHTGAQGRDLTLGLGVRRAADRRVPARPLAEPRRRDRGARRPPARAQRGAAARCPRTSRSTPSSCACSSAGARRWAPTAASTGARPRRSPSPRCWSTARPCGSPARTPSAAPSATATWSSTTPRPAARSRPSRTSPTRSAPIEVHNSPLSEVACLGFEYGYSQEAPETLVLWEAQFGDFVNAAQVIIDQFIVSGLAKWGQTSRLTLLLPARLRGLGPRALLGAAGALPGARRRGQHPRGQPDDAGPVLPPAAPAGADRQAAAARAHDAQVAAAPAAGDQPHRAPVRDARSIPVLGRAARRRGAGHAG